MYDRDDISRMQLSISNYESKLIAAQTSNFKVECPKCGHVNDFSEDRFEDELVDDSSTSEMPCEDCEIPMEIQTHATYRLEVVQ